MLAPGAATSTLVAPKFEKLARASRRPAAQATADTTYLSV
jgi:hypothetical protein